MNKLVTGSRACPALHKPLGSEQCSLGAFHRFDACSRSERLVSNDRNGSKVVISLMAGMGGKLPMTLSTVSRVSAALVDTPIVAPEAR